MAAHCWVAGWDNFKYMYVNLILRKENFLGRFGLLNFWGIGEKLNYFWSQGVIMFDYLEQGRTINSACYADKLRRLHQELARKRPGKLTCMALD